MQNNKKYDTPEHIAKTFAKLMLQGKVNAALKLLNKAANLGIADLTEETVNHLKELHPEGKEVAEGVLITDEPEPYFDPVVFSNIDETSIAKAAIKTRGAAGPSGLDAEGWRRMLISKNFGTDGKELRTAIAKMTQIMCVKEIEVNPELNKTNLEAYTACRLMPLNKEPSGIRPI